MSSMKYHEVLASARELQDYEKKKLVSDLNIIIGKSFIETTTENLCCPYCGSTRFVKNGKNKETQRYLCKNPSCHKSFISVTNTPVYYSHKDMYVWNQYIDCLIDGYSLRKTIGKVNISLRTAFFWRHKILDAIRENLSADKLCGKMEADETYFRESFKGNHSKDGFKMPRQPRRRGTPSKYRGISKEQVCVLTALDLERDLIINPVCMGKPGSSDLIRALGDKIKKESILVTDSLYSYRILSSYCRIKHISIPTGHYSFRGYNIQRINNLHSRLKDMMRVYRGVSTKYLGNYLYLFKYLFKKVEAPLALLRGSNAYSAKIFRGRPPIFI